MDLELLRCVGRATIQYASRALRESAPLGTALDHIAREALDAWRKVRPSVEDRRAELEALAQADAITVRQQAQQVAQEVAPPETRAALAGYLEHLPSTVRRTLARAPDTAGHTAPVGLSPANREDLLRFLLPRPPRFKVGDRPDGVKGLVLEELLGLGGFGEVWKARRPSRTGNPAIALKFCLDADAARKLGHEAALNRIMSQGRHPGIVKLLDKHLQANPPCLEYEYVEGGDLARLIPAGAATPDELVERSLGLMHELAGIIAFAHDLQPPVVHRDLKPSNILVQQTVIGPRLRVTDFGIGDVAAQQAVRQSLSHSVRAALTGRLGGAHTVHYAPKEQVDGAPADPRDDVYALGVI